MVIAGAISATVWFVVIALVVVGMLIGFALRGRR
jgi:hypothetical protein